MRIKPFILAVFYCFFSLIGRVYGIGEKTITLGSSASWELIEKKQGIIEARNIRPHPVLVLTSEMNFGGNAGDEGFLDLQLSFDEGRPAGFADSRGHYDVFVSPELASAGAPYSRYGNGAALFTGTTNEPIVLKPRKSALFAPGNHIRDFSIEFWVYPQNLENGEQILLWNSSKPDDRNSFTNQRIQAVVSKSRLHWSFDNVFFSPGEKNRKSLSFSGPLMLNRNWSHHLIRFDADLGLLEYLVDGRVEVIDYTTSSGRENGEVYTPVIGDNCSLALASRFTGMMDEFRIYRSYIESPDLSKYPSAGGRVESRTLDLGYSDSRVIKIEAFGGQTESLHTSNAIGRVRNEYTGNNALRFQNHTEITIFARTSNSPYRWNDIPWVPVNPGMALADTFKGRFIQLAADFYPSADGETSPYLSELRVIFCAAEPPLPPNQVKATAKDGAVELSWKVSPSTNVEGYLVYCGTAKGEYLDERSPIDVGNRTSFLVEGLKNGTIYYFTVAAYTAYAGYKMPSAGAGLVYEPGEFSKEAAARPLRMAE
jgi:hypothetical protein